MNGDVILTDKISALTDEKELMEEKMRMQSTKQEQALATAENSRVKLENEMLKLQEEARKKVEMLKDQSSKALAKLETDCKQQISQYKATMTQLEEQNSFMLAERKRWVASMKHHEKLMSCAFHTITGKKTSKVRAKFAPDRDWLGQQDFRVFK